MIINLANRGYIKIGLQTHWAIPLERPFVEAKKLKLKAVEIFFDKKGIHGFMPRDLKDDARNFVRKNIINGIDVTVHAPNMDYSNNSWISEFEDTLNFCSNIYNCPVTIHPPILEYKKILSEMGKIILSSKTKSNILFENTIDTTSPFAIDRYIKFLSDFIGREVGLTFDAGHANIATKNPYKFLMGVDSRIKHLHLHNNFSDTDSHLSITNGTIDFRMIIDILSKRNFSGIGILEYWRPEFFERDINFLRELES